MFGCSGECFPEEKFVLLNVSGVWKYGDLRFNFCFEGVPICLFEVCESGAAVAGWGVEIFFHDHGDDDG